MAGARKLRRVSPGQRPLAEDINQLIDWAELKSDVRAGPGISVTHSDRAVVIALAAAFGEIFVPAIITQVFGALPDDLPANVKYTAKAIGQGGATVTQRVPDMGRQYAIARIVRAAIGDPCFIVRAKNTGNVVQARLWVFTEKVATAECTGGSARGGGGWTADELARLIKEAVALEMDRRGR